MSTRLRLMGSKKLGVIGSVCDPKGKEGVEQKLTECEINFSDTRFYEDAEKYYCHDRSR